MFADFEDDSDDDNDKLCCFVNQSFFSNDLFLCLFISRKLMDIIYSMIVNDIDIIKTKIT